MAVIILGSQPRMACRAVRRSGKVMLSHFVDVETETQRDQVTGLEVRERVCGRALMKAGADTLVGVSSGSEVVSGRVESVQGWAFTPSPPCREGFHTLCPPFNPLFSVQGGLSYPLSSV